jgi:SSS family solute:Na+ symporter
MGDRMLSIIFIIIFILANAIFIFSKRAKNLAEFTLENRSLGTFKLFGTFLATNLSAFTIFGVSGSAYRIGWAFFPVMAFGTGFMAFSFILFGLPLRKLSLTNNWITPSDFISSRFNSIILGKIVSLLLLIFTLPYIAVQIGSLGSLLSSIVNLPKWICSLVFTAIIAGYILKGGLKSVVKTDIFQLFVLYTFAIVAIFLVFSIFKNEEAVKNIFSKVSEIHQINGKNNSIPFISLLGYYILWFTADPIFPHLTQRFYSAKSDKVLIKSMILYPLACLIIFFSMTFLGIIGTAVFPNLPLYKTDTIFTMLLHKVSGIYAPIFSLAAIAAIMSTLDSQILTCSSMVANDFLIKNKLFNNTATQQKTSDLKNLEDLKNEKSLKITKLLIILISILSYIISLLPISSILSFLTNSAFNGYASLFIIYICALYFPRIEKSSSILTILIGFTLIIFQNLKIINFHLPFIFIILGFEACMLIISNLIIKFLRQIKAKIPQMKYEQVNLVNENEKIINPYLTLKNIIPVIIIFLLGLNIISYFLPLNLFLGLPLWVWYQIIVTILLSAVFYLLFERMEIDIENRTK